MSKIGPKTAIFITITCLILSSICIAGGETQKSPILDRVKVIHKAPDNIDTLSLDQLKSERASRIRDLAVIKEASDEPEVAKQKLLDSILAHDDIVIYTLGYSEIENEIVQKLPPNIRNGYKLAKAVRLGDVFKQLQKDYMDDDYEKLIPTYYLKTCLFFITRDSVDHLKSLSNIQCAIEIYKQLKRRLRDFKRIPHFFQNNNNDITGENVLKIHDSDEQSALKLRHLLVVINRAISFLRNAQP